MAGLSFQPRPFWDIVALVVIASTLLLISGFGHVQAVMLSGSLAQPVDIDVAGLTEVDAYRVTLSAVLVNGQEVEVDRYKAANHWHMQRTWPARIRLHGTQAVLDRIESVQVQIGSERRKFTGDEVRTKWQRVTANPLVLPVNSDSVVSLEMPGKGANAGLSALTWPRDRTQLGLIAAWLWWLPVIAGLAGLFMWAARRPRFQALLERGLLAPSGSTVTARGARWFIFGFSIVVVALVLVETIQPYYFTQDDNFAQFLPVIVQGCRAVFSGKLPLWNPYQFMGAPVITLGVYALTYPGTYLSYVIARYVLSNEYLTIEVFAWLHILAGYTVTYITLREMRLRPMLASVGAFCFVLSGFALVFGRSWYYMLPVLVWAPLLVLAINRLVQGRGGWRWALGTGLAIGLFFHAGNAQMWVYGLLFVVVATGILLRARAIPFRRALWLVPALLLGAGVAAPLALLQLAETSQIDRIGGLGTAVGAAALPHMLLPLGKLVSHPTLFGLRRSYEGAKFYTGSFFAGALLVGGWALCTLLTLYKTDGGQRRRLLRDNVWLICAILALILAVGRPGILWIAMEDLPGFNKFNVPAKYFGYFSLFTILGGGLLIERQFRPVKQRTELWFAVAAASLVLVHVSLARESFYDYAAQPYSRLPDDMSSLLAAEPGARAISIGPKRSVRPDFYTSLRNNFPTVAQVMTIDGYDPLVAGTREDMARLDKLESDPVATARACGVRWVLMYEPGTKWQFGPDPEKWKMEVTAPREQRVAARLVAQASLALRTPAVSVYQLADSSPMAFSASKPDRALPVRFDWSGARVDVSNVPAHEPIVVNALARPWMRVAAGGDALESGADEWGRVRFSLTHSSREVTVTYGPPWGKAFSIALALVIVAAICMSGLSYLQQDRRVPEAVVNS